MPSLEGRGGSQPPPQPEEPNKEREWSPFYMASRFANDKIAGFAYSRAQDAIYGDVENDLSVFRLQLDRAWHVAVLGEPPTEELDRALQELLYLGEPVELPPLVLKLLQKRRDQMSQHGSWVEGHYQPGKRLEP